MTRNAIFAAALAVTLAPAGAFAHAFIDHTVPGVGASVAQAPGELELYFTEGVVPSLSGVRITTAAGASISAGKPTADPSNASLLRVHLGKALAPGTYVVHWHVVATDTHPTSGTYKFTVGQ